MAASPLKILLLENVSKTAHEIFAEAGFAVEAVGQALPSADLAARLAGVDILGIRSKTQVRGEGLGMRVLCYDHTAKLPMGNNVAVSSLGELLGRADFVSLHVPETPQTRDMIGAAELSRMRKGSYLLNASRGSVVVLPALR